MCIFHNFSIDVFAASLHKQDRTARTYLQFISYIVIGIYGMNILFGSDGVHIFS
ncbi:uncharacterized protein METZ01_LOCUS238440, partial [marine metagenome]